MSFTINDIPVSKIADEMEKCKTVEQLDMHYKENFVGKSISKAETLILATMYREKYNHILGRPSRWVSGERPNIATQDRVQKSDFDIGELVVFQYYGGYKVGTIVELKRNKALIEFQTNQGNKTRRWWKTLVKIGKAPKEITR